MDERQKVLDALTEVRDDVDFENETELVDDGVIDSLDLTQMIAALDEYWTGWRMLPAPHRTRLPLNSLERR